MDRFVEAGVTTFDCADIYTGVEALIGRWLGARTGSGGGRRCRCTRSTCPISIAADALAAPTSRAASTDRSRGSASSASISCSCTGGTTTCPATSRRPVARRAAARGKIRHIGLTNFDRRRSSEIVAAGVPIASHQVQYSVLDRRPAAGMADAVRAQRHRPALLRRAGRRVPVGAMARRAGSRRSRSKIDRSSSTG